MPGGFLKKLGTDSCGMTGTSVAVARLCAPIGITISEAAHASAATVKGHGRRCFIGVSGAIYPTPRAPAMRRQLTLWYKVNTHVEPQAALRPRRRSRWPPGL